MLREQLSDAYKQAVRGKEQRRVATLRLIMAALKDRDIAARGEGEPDGVSEDAVLEMLNKMVRQRKDCIKLYEEGGRLELAERERREIDVIREFLPQPLSQDEIRDAVEDAIQETGAACIKDMGKCMQRLKSRYSGRMDFSQASGLVRERLVS